MSGMTRVGISKLKRNELLIFNEKVLVAVEGCKGENKVFEDFEKAAKDFAARMAEKHDKSSMDLADYDAEVDRAWMSLNYHLRASLGHPDASIRESTEKIWEVFEKTPSPLKLNFEEEYGALKNLLTQLDRLPAELFEKSLAEPYRQALKNAVDLFLTASHEKVELLSKREVGKLPEAVKACMQAWRALSGYLEYRVNYDANPQVKEAFDKLTVVCSEIKTRLAREKAE